MTFPDALELFEGAVLVTGNRGKLAEIRRLCGARLAAAAIDLEEIQSLELDEILRAKARTAYARLERPVIVEETGLGLDALGGFPGPLVKWMLAAVGAEGIARTALALGSGTATAACAVLYFDGERELGGAGSTPGEMVLPARGRGGFGWDPVFQPAGSSRTYAEMSPAQKDAVSHRAKAWRGLLETLRGGR